MGKHGHRLGYKHATYILGIILIITPLIPNIVSAELTEKEQVWARVYNQESSDSISINLADPELTAFEMWDAKPDGVFYGSSTPSSLFKVTDVSIVNEDDSFKVGWLMNAPDDLIMAGASEFWVNAPIVTNPAYAKTSELNIYRLTDLNFTETSLTNPIAQVEIDVWNHNKDGMHNGYTYQLAKWGDLGALENGFGSGVESPYMSYFHVYAPIYPNTYYYFEHEVTFNAPSIPQGYYNPQIMVSDEDIFSDNIAFSLLNYTTAGGVTEFVNGYGFDPCVNIIFASGQIGGRAFIKVDMEVGDIISFRFTHSDTGWKTWVLNFYPETSPSYWNFSKTFCSTGNTTVWGGGIVLSSDKQYANGGYNAFFLEYLGNPTMQAISIYLPCTDNETLKLFDSEFWVTRGNQTRYHSWSIGMVEMTSATPINYNGTANTSGTLSAVDYEPFETQNKHSSFSGQLKSMGTVVVKGVKKVIEYQNGLVQDTTGAVLSYLWYNSPQYDAYSRIKSMFPNANDGVDAMKDFAQTLFENISKLPDLFANVTTRVGEFIMGEIVGKIQAMWENIKTVFEPIVKVVQEIKAFVTNVINKVFEALVYAMGIIMKTVMVIGFATIPVSIGSISFAIRKTNEYTRRYDPNSKYYTLKKKEKGGK